MRFRCTICGAVHDGIPSYHADRPDQFWDVPEVRREADVFLTSDSCVIADRFFFIRGLLGIPVHEIEDVLTWGVWVSLKEENFFLWQDYYEVPQRSHVGPFFGWLCTRIPVYPYTMYLKTMVHIRDDGMRPRIELEKTAHPLSADQHNGIELSRVMEIIHQVEDNKTDA